MKPNIFLIVVSVLIAALSGYGFYAANSGEAFCLLLSFGSGLTFATTLSGTLGIRPKERAGNVNFKIVSAIFFVLFLISNLLFGFIGMRVAPYIIVNGIILLIYAIIEYGIIKSNE